MKTLTITIIAVLAFIGFIYFVEKYPPMIAKHCSGLYDRQDIEICEGDHLQTPNSLDTDVMYGNYQEITQFYLHNDTGDFPLEDWSNRPQEEWSLIVN